MSNASSSNFEVALIEQIKNFVLATWGIVYIVVGTAGVILNLVVFTRRTRWTLSPSIPYLLASTIAGVPTMYVAVLSRVGIGFQITPFYYIPILCKTQVYISNACTSFIIWCMLGSCWDRHLASSRNAITRRLSSTRTSYRVISAIILCVSLAYAQIFYCFEGGLTTASAPCSAKNLPCSVIDTTLIFFLQFMTPTLLILFFLIGVHLNVRRMQYRRQMQISIAHQRPEMRKNRETDRIVLRLVLVQVLFFLLCSTPLFAYRLYSTLSTTVVKSNVRRAVENLIFNITVLLFYFDKVFLFYIHILTSRHFRQVLWRFIGTVYRPNAIRPQH